MPQKLTLVAFDSQAIYLPKDVRFDFLRNPLGFRDLDGLGLNMTLVKMYLPNNCI
jgi:hypothetical protein